MPDTLKGRTRPAYALIFDAVTQWRFSWETRIDGSQKPAQISTIGQPLRQATALEFFQMASMTFDQRKALLEGMLRRGDMDGIMQFYLGPMLGGGIMVQPGTLASTMIAEILKREFPGHSQD